MKHSEWFSDILKTYQLRYKDYPLDKASASKNVSKDQSSPHKGKQ